MVITLHTKEYLLNVGDGHGAHIHDYDLDTSGRIDVYYKGQQFGGTWSSTDSHGPLNFTLDNGQAVTLPPGLGWIDVVQEGPTRLPSRRYGLWGGIRGAVWIRQRTPPERRARLHP